MSTVRTIVDAIGRAEIARAVGRTPAAVGNALSDDSFPSGWYPTMRDLCEKRGIDCPMHLFNWARAKTSQASGDAA